VITRVNGDVIEVSRSIWLGDRPIGGVKIAIDAKVIRASISSLRQHQAEVREEGFRQTILLTLVIAGGLIGLGILVAAFFARHLVRPIKELTEIALEVGQKQHVRPLATDRRDEVGDLIRAFAEMDRLLKEADAERDATVVKLNNALDEAFIANRAKSDFLSSMSHELRTPMNAVLGFSQLLESDTEHPLTDSQRELVEEILKAGGHLMELISEVLNLARIESGRIDLSMEDLEPAGVLKECLELVRPLAVRNHIEIITGDTLKSIPKVYADRLRLKQVVVNLLTNGIKYNKPEGKVEIYWQPASENRCRLIIEDTGKGISDADQNEIFEPFKRLSGDNTIEGTGIGLTICRRLVEGMGGQIGVESTLHAGSKFWIELETSRGDGGERNNADAAQSGETRQHQSTASPGLAQQGSAAGPLG
jgi:signal transduction histidine kinase